MTNYNWIRKSNTYTLASSDLTFHVLWSGSTIVYRNHYMMKLLHGPTSILRSYFIILRSYKLKYPMDPPCDQPVDDEEVEEGKEAKTVVKTIFNEDSSFYSFPQRWNLYLALISPNGALFYSKKIKPSNYLIASIFERL